MNYSIPHGLLVINQVVIDDPVMLESFYYIFQWANEMGLKGKKVGNLIFKKGNMSQMPTPPFGRFFCQIDCTKEEWEHFEEMRKLRIDKFINDLMSE